MALLATILVNIYGLRLKLSKNDTQRKKLRYDYCSKQLELLRISVKIANPEKLPTEGKYVFLINHRSIIDPPVLEVIFGKNPIFGHWISKKELYNSFFFGLFVRNAGTILLDREASQMGGFFKEIKEKVALGDSIFMFPEGTRNKTDEELTPFKDGSRIIALKNRIPMLPIYIKTRTNEAVTAAMNDPKLHQELIVMIGDPIDYKDKSVNIEDAYREMFGIEAREK